MPSRRTRTMVIAIAAAAAAAVATPAIADHSWGNYHWARTTPSFTLKLGNNVGANWQDYLAEASRDWSRSRVLDTQVVGGLSRNVQSCNATLGRVEVCSFAYGQNLWLGIAQIWIEGDHIVQGTARMNDSYFNMARFNTPAWRRLVMCQEIAHTFGLDHQDEDFSNANLGTCMDYTSNPEGPPSNEHPNRHDYEQIETIYAHLDTTTTVGSATAGSAVSGGLSPSEWGRAVAFYRDGRARVYERDLAGGQRMVTFVFWVPGARAQ